MIYRSWSLLTGPPAILGGIVAAVLVGNYLYFGDPLPSPWQRKPDTPPLAKKVE